MQPGWSVRVQGALMSSLARGTRPNIGEPCSVSLAGAFASTSPALAPLTHSRLGSYFPLNSTLHAGLDCSRSAGALLGVHAYRMVARASQRATRTGRFRAPMKASRIVRRAR